MIDKSIFSKAVSERYILDAHVNLRINKRELEEFKKVCGKGYQTKIRELMKGYTDYVNQIDNVGQRKRTKYLNDCTKK